LVFSQSYFEPFGEIVSCKVFGMEEEKKEADENNDDAAPGAPQQQKAHQGYGFVCFTNYEDARKALEHFHEKGDESVVVMDASKAGAADDPNA